MWFLPEQPKRAYGSFVKWTLWSPKVPATLPLASVPESVKSKEVMDPKPGRFAPQVVVEQRQTSFNKQRDNMSGLTLVSF